MLGGGFCKVGTAVWKVSEEGVPSGAGEFSDRVVASASGCTAGPSGCSEERLEVAISHPSRSCRRDEIAAGKEEARGVVGVLCEQEGKRSSARK